MRERNLPYIKENNNGVPVLYVNEKLFFMLAGELHNSAASCLEFMEREVWPYLRPFAINTVLFPIAWESIESERGIFDFSLLSGLIDQARREQKKIVLLWFGLWKNGESFYVPAWVKEDYMTYFRACYASGVPSDTISPLCEAAVEADKNAFVHLLEFIRDYDGEEQTVIMIQVENEIGFLNCERDYSYIAEKKYEQIIPKEMQLFRKKESLNSGTWEQEFGKDAAEMFMAYVYACAVEKIASAGKNIYPIPMYVNAWLRQHPERPGIYPSGGPVSTMLPIWKACAPSLDFIAPDIYVPDFKKVCKEYSTQGNPLFIPEARRDPITASNVFWAFGGMNALGFSPFAIEDFLREDFAMPDEEQLNELNIAVQGFDCKGTGPYLQRSYEVLKGMLPLIAKYRGTDKLKAFIQENPNERGTTVSLEGYDIQLDYISGKTGSAGIILLEDKGFFIAGTNTKITLLPSLGSGKYLTVVRMEEGKFEEGIWKRRRILNGDELHDKNLGDMAEIKYLRLSLHGGVEETDEI